MITQLNNSGFQQWFDLLVLSLVSFLFEDICIHMVEEIGGDMETNGESGIGTYIVVGFVDQCMFP